MDEDVNRERRNPGGSGLRQGSSSFLQIFDAIKANVQQEIAPSNGISSFRSIAPADKPNQRSNSDTRVVRSEERQRRQTRIREAHPLHVERRATNLGDVFMAGVNSVLPLNRNADDDSSTGNMVSASAISAVRRSSSMDISDLRFRSKSEDIDAMMEQHYQSGAYPLSSATPRRHSLNLDDDNMSIPSSATSEFNRRNVMESLTKEYDAEHRADRASVKANTSEANEEDVAVRRTRRGRTLAERKADLLEELAVIDQEIQERLERRNKIAQALNTIGKSLAQSTKEGRSMPNDVYVPPRKLKPLPTAAGIADNRRERERQKRSSTKKEGRNRPGSLHTEAWDSIDIHGSDRSEESLPIKNQVHPRSA